MILLVAKYVYLGLNMHGLAPKYMFDLQLCAFMLESPCQRLIIHVWVPLGMLGSHSCSIVPEDACWDPNIDDIASIFSFEPDSADLSTKMRVLVPVCA